MNDLLGVVDWSRAQFAMTAMYHWLFVPLTIGLSLIVAIMESIYVRTGDTRWRNITKFWMTLFGINFACGVATGIILEFEFGTNWSNYSWFVGDIFGAPLAIEGIVAFFMEATFVAVMFFGWNKVRHRREPFGAVDSRCQRMDAEPCGHDLRPGSDEKRHDRLLGRGFQPGVDE